MQSQVTIEGAVFPDGSTVTGVWTVIGRHGDELIAECHGTIIRFPEHLAQVHRSSDEGTVPGRTRKTKRGVA